MKTNKKFFVRAIRISTVAAFLFGLTAFAPAAKAENIKIQIRNKTNRAISIKLQGIESNRYVLDTLQPGRARVYTVDSQRKYARVTVIGSKYQSEFNGVQIRYVFPTVTRYLTHRCAYEVLRTGGIYDDGQTRFRLVGSVNSSFLTR